jgi:hypothetical protein
LDRLFFAVTLIDSSLFVNEITLLVEAPGGTSGKLRTSLKQIAFPATCNAPLHKLGLYNNCAEPVTEESRSSLMRLSCHTESLIGRFCQDSNWFVIN